MEDLNTFNQLLFNEESGLLFAICNNLIYSISKSFCTRNAYTIINYFEANGKLVELFKWSFKQDFLMKDCLTEYFETNSFFAIFHYFYCVDHLEDFLKNVTCGVFKDEITISTLNVDLLKENFDQVTIDTSSQNTYFSSLISLGQLVYSCISSFKNSKFGIPDDYKVIIKALIQLIEEMSPGNEKKAIKHVFKAMYFDVLSLYFSNRVALRKSHSSDLICKYETKLTFLGETFKKIGSGSNDLYIKHLKTTIGDDDEFINDFIDKIFDSPQPPSTKKNQQFSPIEMISLMRSNAPIFVRGLNQSVARKFIQSFKSPEPIIDDCLIHNEAVLAIENMSRTYNSCVSAGVGEIENKSKTLLKIKEEFEKTNNILLEKQQKNDGLIEKINTLRAQRKMSLVERDELIPMKENSPKSPTNPLSKKRSFKSGVMKLFGPSERRKSSNTGVDVGSIEVITDPPSENTSPRLKTPRTPKWFGRSREGSITPELIPQGIIPDKPERKRKKSISLFGTVRKDELAFENKK